MAELESRAKRALVLCVDALHAAAWAGALGTAKFSVSHAPRDIDPQLAVALLDAGGEPPTLFIAELAHFMAHNRNPYQFARRFTQANPAVALVLVMPDANPPLDSARAVAQSYGAIELIAKLPDDPNAARTVIDTLWFSACAQKVAPRKAAAPEPGWAPHEQLALDFRATLRNEARRSFTPMQFFQFAMQGGLSPVAGEEALARLVSTHLVLENSAECWFCVDTPPRTASNKALTDSATSEIGKLRALSQIDIALVAKQMRGQTKGIDGVEVKDRRFHFKLYPQCFVGAEAVDWLIATQQVARPVAAKIGLKLVEEGLIRHVVDDQDFRDGNYFYRFV